MWQISRPYEFQIFNCMKIRQKTLFDTDEYPFGFVIKTEAHFQIEQGGFGEAGNTSRP